MKLRFCFPIRPVPKQSYRAVNGGGYLPKNVVQFKKAMQLMTKSQLKTQNDPFCELLTCPVKVSIEICYKAPKTHAKSISDAMPYIPKDTRPDLDNLCKAVWDSFNGIVWADDSQVVVLTAAKWYGLRDEIIVIVETL